MFSVQNLNDLEGQGQSPPFWIGVWRVPRYSEWVIHSLTACFGFIKPYHATTKIQLHIKFEVDPSYTFVGVIALTQTSDGDGYIRTNGQTDGRSHQQYPLNSASKAEGLNIRPAFWSTSILNQLLWLYNEIIIITPITPGLRPRGDCAAIKNFDDHLEIATRSQLSPRQRHKHTMWSHMIALCSCCMARQSSLSLLDRSKYLY